MKNQNTKDKWLTGNYVCYVKEESKGIWREWLATYLPLNSDYVLINNKHKDIAEAVIANPATKTEFKSNNGWYEDDFFGNYHNNGDMFQWRLKQKIPLAEPFRVTEHPTSKAFKEMVEKEEGVRPSSNKYSRNCKGVEIDVYDVLQAFNVTNPATQHAIKKLLAGGQRGYKDTEQDLHEAIASIYRAIELEDN